MSYMKIEIWGTYPPPIGGVSIHIYRLIHSLHTIDSSVVLRNFGKQVSNISYVKHVSYPWMEFLLLPFRKKRIIHLHSNNIFAFALFLLFGGRHKVGVTLHNQNLIKKTQIYYNKKR
jgi:glycosyltransferase involved in cell wall biosynthesis